MGVFQSHLAVTCCGRNCGHNLCGYEDKQCLPHRSKGEAVVFVAKKITTMDPAWPTATAVAVQDGRILSVGDEESLCRSLEGAGRRYRVDRTFADLFISPGFIEQHNHPLVGGTAMSLLNISSNPTPNPFGEDYTACATREQVLERMRSACTRLAPGEELLAWGWDSVVVGGHVHRKELDSVASDRAVLIWDRSLHCGYCNSYAIKMLGLVPSKWRKVPGVVFDEDGEFAGQFLAIRALAALKPIFAKVLRPRRALHSIRYLTELARKGGITTTSEMMQGGINLALERLLYPHFFNDANCPIRCVCTVEAPKAVAACFGSTSWAVKWVRSLQKTSTPKLIYNNGVKFFADDAFVALTMQVGFPGYLDGREGLWNNEQGQAAVKRMLPWWKAGCRIHVHSNGDAAHDATAEALQALQRHHPRFDHRFCFEHYGISSEAMARRLKALGASAACNIYYPYYRGEVNESSLGCDRAHTASRLKTIIDAGVPCAMHTDSPIAPPRPLEEIWFAVNRKLESGKVLAPHERVDVYRAMRMKTVDAAHVLGLDMLLGTIEAGKCADFTVLHEDIFAVAESDPMRIRDIEVWGTVLGGVPHPRDQDWELASQPPEGLVEGVLWLGAQSAPGRGALTKASCAAALRLLRTGRSRSGARKILLAALAVVAAILCVCLPGLRRVSGAFAIVAAAAAFFLPMGSPAADAVLNKGDDSPAALLSRRGSGTDSSEGGPTDSGAGSCASTPPDQPIA